MWGFTGVKPGPAVSITVHLWARWSRGEQGRNMASPHEVFISAGFIFSYWHLWWKGSTWAHQHEEEATWSPGGEPVCDHVHLDKYMEPLAQPCLRWDWNTCRSNFRVTCKHLRHTGMKRRGSGRLGTSKYHHHFLKEWVLKTTDSLRFPGKTRRGVRQSSQAFGKKVVVSTEATRVL